MKKYSKDVALLKRNGLIIASVWTIILILSFFWNAYQQKEKVHLLAINSHKLSFDKDATYRLWAANHGGVYVPVSEHTPPNPYLSHVPERDITTASGRVLTLINPAYMTRQVHELGEELYGEKGNLTSLNPLRPENIADPWEEQALKEFQRGQKEAFAIEDIDGEPHMRFMSPLIVKKGCLKCHENQGYEVGDVQGGISMSSSISPYYAHLKSRQQSLLAGHGVIWLAGLFLIGLMTFRIVSVREASDFERSKAENALRKSEEKYRSLIEQSVEMIYLHDLDGNFLEVNQAAVLHTGHSMEEYLNMKVFDLHSDQSLTDDIIQQWNKCEIGQSFTMEMVHLHKNGSELPVELTISKVRFENNEYILSLARDIRERKEAEKIQKKAFVDIESRTKELESLLEGAKTIIEGNDFETTVRHIFNAVSNMIGTQSGYVALLSESGEENELLFLESGGLECTVNPNLPMPIRGLRNEVYKTGHGAYENDFWNSPWIKFMPKGHATLKNVMFAPLNIKDKTVGLIGLANKPKDFTENDRHIAEAFGKLAAIALLNSRNLAALETSEEKYRSILDKIEDGYFEVDITGTSTFFNDSMCRILGYSRTELIGMNYKGLVNKKNGEKVFQSFNQVFTTGDPIKAFDWELIKKDGSLCYVDASVALIKDINGNAIGFRGIIRDISNRKKAETEKENLQNQLHQAQKMESVGRLAGGVAHDFNNMLSVIQGYAEIARESLPDDDTVQDYITEILNAARRSAGITRQLLAFARKQTISPKVLGLNDSVVNMLKMIRRLIGENIDLSWQPGARLWPVKMDLTQLDQILVNLCVNTRDAINGVGKLTIETENIFIDEAYCTGKPYFFPGEYVMLAVSDNGHGMDKETLDHIFEPFFTTKNLGEGTGLGLSTVYGILKQNNGFINVYSEPGKGTTIRIYLPRYEGQVEGSKEMDVAAIPKGHGETILIVEDETSIMKLAKKILEQLGYRPLVANSPSEAIELTVKNQGTIDVLMTDVVMPEMNGRKLAEEIHRYHPNIKVLYMSGYTANVIAHHGILDEDVNFIQKPFSVKNLAVKVQEVLSAK